MGQGYPGFPYVGLFNVCRDEHRISPSGGRPVMDWCLNAIEKCILNGETPPQGLTRAPAPTPGIPAWFEGAPLRLVLPLGGFLNTPLSMRRVIAIVSLIPIKDDWVSVLPIHNRCQYEEVQTPPEHILEPESWRDQNLSVSVNNEIV